MLFRTKLTAICLASLLATPAFASDEADVISRMQHTIDAANKGIDASSLATNFTSSVVLVDDLAPFVFTGPPADAISAWTKAYGADSEKNDISGFSEKLLKPRRLKVDGDHAYLVLPAIYSFKQHGKPARIDGVITATLEKVGNTWLISTWSWAGK